MVSCVWPGDQLTSFLATVSRLVLRSVAAWALPRPSATASARFANITVSQSQTTMVQLKMLNPGVRKKIAVTVVSSAPTSTTNMTGFLSWTRGSSFRSASGSDCQSIFGSSRPPPTRPCAAPAFPARRAWSGLVASVISVQSFCERAQGEGGEIGQADEHEDDADEHADEQRLVGLQCAGAGRHRLLPGERPAEAECEDHRREPGHQHDDPADRVVPVRIGRQAGERRTVVISHRR